MNKHNYSIYTHHLFTLSIQKHLANQMTPQLAVRYPEINWCQSSAGNSNNMGTSIFIYCK